ncbi:hypothetical protein CEXT_450561 [Caerostris extrusa]|uniref:Uncharacterized protein n=1 Tax=Caerostris extrusa TaxID=172846 RepID=A0AAV4UNX2_CAEEX|nr:hypothetical protein CEXT_450561 [Caerostris extrusa]
MHKGFEANGYSTPNTKIITESTLLCAQDVSTSIKSASPVMQSANKTYRGTFFEVTLVSGILRRYNAFSNGGNAMLELEENAGVLLFAAGCLVLDWFLNSLPFGTFCRVD